MNIFHVTNSYKPKNEDAIKRNAYAQKSWDKLYTVSGGITPLGISTDDLGRNSSVCGDEREVPFVKDILDYAVTQMEDADYVLFTNSDTIMHHNIVSKLTQKEFCYGARRELEKDQEKLLSERQIEKLELAHQTSADLFFFSKKWWLKNRDAYPDMLLGCQWWDTLLLDLMESQSPGCRLTTHIYHRNHQPFWFSKETMFKNPGQMYNRRLVDSWNNPNPRSEWREVRRWEEKLRREFESNLGKYRLTTGKATIAF